MSNFIIDLYVYMGIMCVLTSFFPLYTLPMFFFSLCFPIVSFFFFIFFHHCTINVLYLRYLNVAEQLGFFSLLKFVLIVSATLLQYCILSSMGCVGFVDFVTQH